MSAVRVHPRIAARRRKPSLAARLRPFWILGIVVAALGGWGAYALSEAPLFRVTRVGVDLPPAAVVSATQVRAAAAIPRDANVWLLRPGAIARRVEAIPFVDRVTVHRGQFPRPFVELTVTLRRPAACVRGGGGHEVTIDASARVLQTGCALRSAARVEAGGAPLPAPGARLDGAAVGRLLADARTLSAAGIEVRRIGLDRWGDLEATDAAGVTLRLGDDADLARKAALIGPVRAGVGPHRVLRAIDLRAPRTPIVELR